MARKRRKRNVGANVLGDHLRRWRRRNGLTQQEAADWLEVHQVTWARWESGARRLARRDLVLEVADFLEVPPARIIAWGFDISSPVP